MEMPGNRVRRAAEQVQKMRFQLGTLLFLDSFGIALAAGAFAGGCVILAGRVLWDSWSGSYSIACIFVLLAFAIIRGVFSLVRLLPGSREMLIYLDSRSPDSDGLLLVGLERELGEWDSEARPPAAVPRFRWRSPRKLLLLLPGALFCFGTALYPLPESEELIRRQLEITEELQRIEEKLELLAEEKLLPEEVAEELKTALQELQERNDARDSSRIYETLEALESRADSIGEAAGERTSRQSSTLEMVAAGSEALSMLKDEILRDKAFGELAEIARQLGLADSELAEFLKQSGFGKNIDPASLDPETLRKMAESLRNNVEKLRERLEKLKQAKLCRSGSSGCEHGNCDNPDACAAERLAEWLAANSMEAEGLLAVMMKCGVDGVSRGPGDADLEFTGNSQDAWAARREVAVQGQESPASSGALLAEMRVAPAEPGEASAVKAGALQGGESAFDERTLRIHPAHRAVVERYFKSSQ